ncbi:conserved hypothetical protein [Ricinus communis]|uniref:Uncharacterized protein n=1 Tax=Ricinus communis TaxID=3988 RepID=B9T4P6_RICCO|nr:conserved hypothetical protein [Ricinus communis]
MSEIVEHEGTYFQPFLEDIMELWHPSRMKGRKEWYLDDMDSWIIRNVRRNGRGIQWSVDECDFDATS